MFLRKDQGLQRDQRDREEIKAGKSDEEFVRKGSDEGIKDCKEIKDREEVRNCCSYEEFKTCKDIK